MLKIIIDICEYFGNFDLPVFLIHNPSARSGIKTVKAIMNNNIYLLTFQKLHS